MRKLEELEKKVRELEKRLEGRLALPLASIAEDAAFYEAVFDVLVINKICTREEIKKYMDSYRSAMSVILAILGDKGIATPRDVQIHMMAFHHMIRMHGLNPNMTYEEMAKERTEFAEMLKKLPDPLAVVGQ